MKLRPNTDHVSGSPLLVVDAGLAPGRHRFRLVVETECGRQSRPAEVIVTILPAAVGRRPSWLTRVLAALLRMVRWFWGA